MKKPERREITTTIITIATAAVTTASAAAATARRIKRKNEQKMDFVYKYGHSLTHFTGLRRASVSVAPRSVPKISLFSGDRGPHSAESAHVFGISIFPYILLLYAVYELYVGSFIWSHEMLWKFKYIRLCCLYCVRSFVYYKSVYYS